MRSAIHRTSRRGRSVVPETMKPVHRVGRLDADFGLLVLFTGVGEADARVRRWIRSVRVDLAHDLRRDRVQFGQALQQQRDVAVLPASWWYVGAVKLLFCALSLAIPAGMAGKTLVGGARDRPSNRISAELLPGTKKALGVCRIQAASNPYAGKSQPIGETRTRYSRKFRVNRAKGDVCCPHSTAKRDQSDRLLARNSSPPERLPMPSCSRTISPPTTAFPTDSA